MTQKFKTLEALTLGDETVVGKQVLSVKVPYTLAKKVSRNKTFSVDISGDGKVDDEYNVLKFKYGSDKDMQVDGNSITVTLNESNKDAISDMRDSGYCPFLHSNDPEIGVDIIFIEPDSVSTVTYEYDEVEEPQ